VESARVLTLAREVGFDDAGIAPVALPQHEDDLNAWLAAGHHASMAWLERNAEVRVDLRARFPWAKSVVVVLRSYRPDPESTPAHGLSRFVSSYARGTDYHDVLTPRLEGLGERLRAEVPDLDFHAYVDTGPVLERQLAVAAGLGWQGNNTLLLNALHGSRFFLGVLITSLDLAPTPARVGSCGSCRACQPACPTGAFVAPGVLDAGRCISYLTIEHRGPIPRSIRPAMGQWLFGCDLCQTSCPFEVGASAGVAEPAFHADNAVLGITLPELLRLDDEAFRARFRRTPLWRPKRVGLLRNALIVVGNGEHFDCLPPAVELLRDSSEVVREAASWALARLFSAGSQNTRDVIDALVAARNDEVVDWVADGMDEDLARLHGV